jgi:replicative DNA helicase
LFLAGPGVGKSFVMCHCAASNLIAGKNVLYITLEMSEEMIQQRIEENLLDVDYDTLLQIPKNIYLRRIENIRKNTVGKLKVKEYPTRQAGAAHFRALLRELKMKQGFVPDIIYLDYLNICISSTLKNNKASIYEYVKVVGEEIRGLGVEFDVPIISATQFNREGYRSSSPGMDDVSESFGTSFTADLILALLSTEELEKDNLLQFIQIKNRYNDVNKPKNFLVGINRAKMQLHNVSGLVQSKMSMSKEDRDEFVKQDLNFKEISPFDEFS